MNGAPRRSLRLLCLGLLLPPVLSAQVAAGRSRFYASGPSSLVEQRLLLPAPTGADAATFQSVPAAGVGRPPAGNQSGIWAQATTAPWIDSNAWRFQRGLRKANYANLPAGAAGLAAAEAFAFGVDAIVDANAGDEPELGRVLRFLQSQDQPALPALANIGVVDDGSAVMGEVLNMLTRRNLLYRVVSRPDSALDLNVQLGTGDFPREAAANPSEFAARVREKLSDDKRLVRIYGSTTLVAHLTGDRQRTRLYLLSYSRNRPQTDVRIRIRGRHEPVAFAAYGTAADAKLTDIQNPGNATEFSLPVFSTIAIVDLKALK